MNIVIDSHEFTRLKQILSAASLLVLAGDGVGIVLGSVTFYPNDGTQAAPGNSVGDGSP